MVPGGSKFVVMVCGWVGVVLGGCVAEWCQVMMMVVVLVGGDGAASNFKLQLRRF